MIVTHPRLLHFLKETFGVDPLVWEGTLSLHHESFDMKVYHSPCGRWVFSLAYGHISKEVKSCSLNKVFQETIRNTIRQMEKECEILWIQAAKRFKADIESDFDFLEFKPLHPLPLTQDKSHLSGTLLDIASWVSKDKILRIYVFNGSHPVVLCAKGDLSTIYDIPVWPQDGDEVRHLVRKFIERA